MKKDPILDHLIINVLTGKRFTRRGIRFDDNSEISDCNYFGEFHSEHASHTVHFLTLSITTCGPTFNLCTIDSFRLQKDTLDLK